MFVMTNYQTLSTLHFKYNHEIQTLQRTKQSNLIHRSRYLSNFAQNLPINKFPQIWSKWIHTNYIPEKRKFSGILCFRQQRRRRVRRVTISLSAR